MSQSACILRNEEDAHVKKTAVDEKGLSKALLINNPLLIGNTAINRPAMPLRHASLSWHLLVREVQMLHVLLHEVVKLFIVANDEHSNRRHTFPILDLLLNKVVDEGARHLAVIGSTTASRDQFLRLPDVALEF